MAAEAPPAGKPGALYWGAAAGVLLLGAVLRAYRIGQQLILDDEWHALNAVQDHGYRWIFSHLGHADHSIPLTLLYEFLSRTTGLDEWTMRLPLLLAGIALLVLLPWLLRHWLRPAERLLLMALLAISPLLINYSRIARPYALLALLAAAAIPTAWRWWQRRSPTPNAWAWYACALISGWLNPVTLATTTAPFLWFLPSALRAARRDSRYGPLLRACGMSVMLASGLVLLLFVPLSVDWASLAVKSGVHAITPETPWVALTLFAGTGSTWLALAMLALAVTGWVELQRREAGLARVLLLIGAAAAAAVLATGAAWIGHGIVVARYLIGLLPLYLALAAIGTITVAQWLVARAGLAGASPGLLAALVVPVLLLAGPLPDLDYRHSQFLHHMAWQFDYRSDRNPIRAALADVRVPDFYRDIAAAHPDGGALIVEAPWHLESNWNPLPLYQQAHGQRVQVGFVGGLCAGSLYGELRGDVEGLEFRNFVRLADLLNGPAEADYLVFRHHGLPGARPIAMDTAQCEAALTATLGPPWRSTDTALVFRLGAGP
ncbi:MAG TPA: hypothetical protein VK830_06510 [Xanthomonadales bacterium]|nr:hypothetical protein [Xanthomonadales bacterium]